MLKSSIRNIVLTAVIMLMPAMAWAQWGLGASYEIRNKEPKNGFGVRVERTIKLPLPLVHLGTRAHFSYFNENNQFRIQDPSVGSTEIGQDITNYDFGVALLGGVSLGLIKPYVGLGLGSETVDVSYNDVPGNLAQGDYKDNDDSKIFYNGFIGTEFSPIPLISPFFEYRFSKFSDPFDVENVKNSKGRVIFGVTLRF